MIYIVGTGVNNMKSNLIYAYPQSKMSKKQFHAKKSVQVINISSGNIYKVDAEVVQEEQMFSSLNKAVAFAEQNLEMIKINPNIQGYLDGEFTDSHIRDIWYNFVAIGEKLNKLHIASPRKKYEVEDFDKITKLNQLLDTLVE